MESKKVERENEKVNWWDISQCLAFAEGTIESELNLSDDDRNAMHKAFKELNSIVDRNQKFGNKVVKVIGQKVL